jgi:hypothetical protein
MNSVHARAALPAAPSPSERWRPEPSNLFTRFVLIVVNLLTAN